MPISELAALRKRKREPPPSPPLLKCHIHKSPKKPVPSIERQTMQKERLLPSSNDIFERSMRWFVPKKGLDECNAKQVVAEQCLAAKTLMPIVASFGREYAMQVNAAGANVTRRPSSWPQAAESLANQSPIRCLGRSIPNACGLYLQNPIATFIIVVCFLSRSRAQIQDIEGQCYQIGRCLCHLGLIFASRIMAAVIFIREL